jgi:dihydrofolate reductase
MTRVRVECFAISADGFAAGPGQSLQQPLGAGGTALHEWAFATRTLQRALLGREAGETGIDDDFAARGFRNVGAWILGRNMFGPPRGPWRDDGWKGWWGENPVYHMPVFVLTHHARAPLPMAGGTTFHFVTEGIESALAQARAAAGDRDVRVGGGPATVRQFLHARLIDEMHLVIVPVLLGAGERLFEGIDLPSLGYTCTARAASSRVTHLQISRRDEPGRTPGGAGA